MGGGAEARRRRLPGRRLVRASARLQHGVDELARLDAERLGPRVVVEREGVGDDLLTRHAAEGGGAHEHLVQRHPQSPHVRRGP